MFMSLSVFSKTRAIDKTQYAWNLITSYVQWFKRKNSKQKRKTSLICDLIYDYWTAVYYCCLHLKWIVCIKSTIISYQLITTSCISDLLATINLLHSIWMTYIYDVPFTNHCMRQSKWSHCYSQFSNISSSMVYWWYIRLHNIFIPFTLYPFTVENVIQVLKCITFISLNIYNEMWHDCYWQHYPLTYWQSCKQLKITVCHWYDFKFKATICTGCFCLLTVLI